MRLLLGIMLAGGVGSVVRYWLTSSLNRIAYQGFPWGTLSANVLGCFLIGLVGQLAIEARWISRDVALVLSTGLLGGLTTFSSFAFESTAMLDRRALGMFALYVAGSLVVGMAAVIVGVRLGRVL